MAGYKGVLGALPMPTMTPGGGFNVASLYLNKELQQHKKPAT